ncbi:MAG: putative 2-aminoethylphosphonate ABC transporter ATP-binding protein [Candidatus Competibacteraceae bacterium]|uniref:Polyamine transporter subunit ATP-binding component of ABC superfamily n=1 Tax=Candidatus Contendobacter odensis Run_B_J11 TaxID=1400861 RepID=A0A7U7GBE7_9GAMM|nr:putative 2-aminoethylphosphonate ABC transporter ATP-binding protein [Candidatus Contendobacter odensis]MBK8535057.1 putative 2-aminoethylphosphonate ABC transporter ATP-binding protein [Candidatus Competibacteraceae bacterium]MBK8753298.1 putative 2-aminoethylphosphonate ABC transporter ATP-binding protein [Candidatus Competibacteraceae bacterium]CDH45324.1 polyamine transporter subunit; ATP-binding component of ABC superfamily [Candidatus Contendobacter odensis Run_B_J11]
MTASYLRIRNLSKRFGDFTALDNVSIDIHKGEFVCFLGPSGCGKTTLLRAISGLDIQTHGTVEQDGRDISALPPAQRDFGIVFQSYALFQNLTVARNIAYGLENRRQTKTAIQQRVKDLLALINLPDSGRKYPSQLSGGQQQRVALARALAISPGLLLLDEPLSALDAKVRVYLRDEIKTLQRRLGITTIMITHDQEEAISMADRIVVMRDGRIEQIGTPLEIYHQPASLFVAEFIGAMNLLPATLVRQGEIQLGQARLACKVDNFTLGAAVHAAVRPEDVVCTGRTNGHANSFQAEVQDLEFMGPFFWLSLGGGELGEHRLRAQVSSQRARELGLRPRDSMHLHIPAEHIRLFAKGYPYG